MRVRLRMLQTGEPSSQYHWWQRTLFFTTLALYSALVLAAEPPAKTCPPKVPDTPPTTAERPPATPTTAEAPVPQNMAYVIRQKQLEGRAYYQLDGKATCKANNDTHTRIKSWANKISFAGDNLLVWGSICNDTPTPIALDKADAELMITRDMNSILYQGECLTYSENPPKLCEKGIWCPVEEGE